MCMDIDMYGYTYVWIYPYVSVQIHHWETKPLIGGMGGLASEHAIP